MRKNHIIQILIIVFILSLITITLKAQNQELYVQTGGAEGVDYITFSLDGTLFISQDRIQMRLFKAENSFELRTEKCYSSYFSDDSNYIACEKLIERKCNEDDLENYFCEESIKIEVIEIKTWKILFSHNIKHSNLFQSFSCFEGGNLVILSANKKKMKIDKIDFRKKSLLNSVVKNISISEGEKVIAISSDKNNILLGGGVNTKVVNLSSEKEFIITNSPSTLSKSSVSFSPNNEILAVPFETGNLNNKGVIALWNLSTCKVVRLIQANQLGISAVTFSADGKMIASASSNSTQRILISENKMGDRATIKVWNLKENKPLIAFEGTSGYTNSVAFHPKKNLLASGGGKDAVDINDDLINIWDIEKAKKISSIYSSRTSLREMCLSPNKKLIAMGGFGSTFILNLNGDHQVILNHDYYIYALAFNPYSNILASGSRDDYIQLYDLEKKEFLTPLKNEASYVNSLAFSPNGNILASGTSEGVDIWNIKTVEKYVLWKSEDDNVVYTSDQEFVSVVFNPNGTLLAIMKPSSHKGKSKVQIWNLKDKKIVKEFSENQFSFLPNWLGFDFSKDEKLVNKRNLADDFAYTLLEGNGVKILNKQTDKELISVFPYYLSNDDSWESGWLAKTPNGLFDGTPNAWKQLIWRFDNNTFNYAPVEAFFKEFYRPGLLQDIFNGNKIEPPTQNLASIDIRQPSVKISEIDGEVADADVESLKKTVKVKVEIVDNFEKGRRDDFPASSGANDVRLFRNGSLVRLWEKDAFELTEKDGCKQFTKTKETPRKAVCETEVEIISGENELSVYGFNHDNVKSNDDVAIVKGAETLKRKGKLQVLAIGVDKYQESQYDLRFAVKDAVDFGVELRTQQAKLNNYDTPDVLQLTDAEATKQNILYALERFAKGENAVRPKGVSNEIEKKISSVNKTQPEDVLIVYFAGHGTAAKDRFYLIPTDGFPKNTENSKERLKQLQKQSISDLELEKVFRELDAGRLLFVIDACNSGQALEAEEKRRGPMNSRGLAQLAYEKGMYILTAAQSYQAALEVSETSTGKSIEHGLLTYSLLEGLNTLKADKDHNKQISEREWFNFAVSEVPKMQLEAMKKRSAEVKKGTRKAEIFVLEGDKNKKVENRSLQTPRVFYRQEIGNNSFIVAKPN